ncbi:hypothetical protein BC835DRAFT_1415923 [Cytidiella melzeri]|nr:hypothetical protein BC835DRAFT_1415923 [Cytidiella melzeri]
MRLSTRLVLFTAIATGVFHTVSAAPYGSEEPRDPNIEGLSAREWTAVNALSLYGRLGSNRDDLLQLQTHGGPYIGHDATVLQSRAEPAEEHNGDSDAMNRGAEQSNRDRRPVKLPPNTISVGTFRDEHGNPIPHEPAPPGFAYMQNIPMYPVKGPGSASRAGVKPGSPPGVSQDQRENISRLKGLIRGIISRLKGFNMSKPDPRDRLEKEVREALHDYEHWDMKDVNELHRLSGRLQSLLDQLGYQSTEELHPEIKRG